MRIIPEHADLSSLEEKIGYSFSDKTLLAKALIHSSFCNENREMGYHSNETLEFLGDSVLSLVTSEYLFSALDVDEGRMTKIKASVVCETALAYVATKLDIGSYVFFGHGEQMNGADKRPSTLSDTLEAIIAAIYLDGGYEPARAFILPYIRDEVEHNIRLFRDYKSYLQEVVQKNKGEILRYELASAEGPEHSKQFTVNVYLNSNRIATGVGSSKKDAEQAAAKDALSLMGINL